MLNPTDYSLPTTCPRPSTLALRLDNTCFFKSIRFWLKMAVEAEAEA